MCFCLSVSLCLCISVAASTVDFFCGALYQVLSYPVLCPGAAAEAQHGLDGHRRRAAKAKRKANKETQNQTAAATIHKTQGAFGKCKLGKAEVGKGEFSEGDFDDAEHGKGQSSKCTIPVGFGGFVPVDATGSVPKQTTLDADYGFPLKGDALRMAPLRSSSPMSARSIRW